MGDLLLQLVRGCFQKLRRAVQLLFQLTVIVHQPFGGQRLDPSYACRHAGLGNDLKGGDHAGIGHMGTAAELDGEISHADHPDDIPVFLAKQRGRPGLSGLFNGHVLYFYRQILLDLLIDDLLHFLYLLRRQCGEVGEVKPQPVFVDGRTCLFHMSPQDHAQSFVQKMSSAVVVGGQGTFLLIHGQFRLIAHLQHPLGHNAHMADLAAQEFYHILHLELAFRRADHALVCLLAAAGGIERSLLHKDGTFLSLAQSLHQFGLRGQNGNRRLPA